MYIMIKFVGISVFNFVISILWVRISVGTYDEPYCVQFDLVLVLELGSDDFNVIEIWLSCEAEQTINSGIAHTRRDLFVGAEWDTLDGII